MIKKFFTILSGVVLVTVGAWFGAYSMQVALAAPTSGSNFFANLMQFGTTTTGCLNGRTTASGIVTAYFTGTACGSGGGGSGGGSWSTTTSNVAGELVNYPNNDTDVVAIGNSATTSAEYWFDPNILRSFFSGKVGIGTTSPYAPLSVVGTGGVVAENFTASSTIATSTFKGAILGDNAATNRTNFFHVLASKVYPASVTTGGLVNLDNSTVNSGPALVITSGFGASATGRLLVINQTNAAFDQDVIIASSSAANTTVLNLKGTPTGKGILKIEHTGSGTGYSNSAALSIDNLAATDAQGIRIKMSTGATGSPLNIVDSASADIFRITSGGLMTVAYASTTAFTSTNASTTNLIVSSITASTQCVQASAQGLLSGTGSACGAGGGGGDAFTHPLLGLSATTSQLLIGTSTASNYELTIATSSAPQLSLSDRLGVSQWTLRNSNANLYFATTTVVGTATSTVPALMIDSNGRVGIGTTSPMSSLSSVGNHDHWGNYFHFGTVPTTDTTYCNSASVCLIIIGNDNTAAGTNLEVINTNAGANAYAFLTVGNDQVTSAGTNFSGLGSNSSGYTNAGFGAALATPNELDLLNSYGPVGIGTGLSTGVIKFWTGGFALANERMRITAAGDIGIGTTTPQWRLNVASSTGPQVTLSDTASAPWNLRAENNSLYFSTSSLTTFATSSVAALELRQGGAGVSIGSTTPFATLSVNPVAGAFSARFAVGSSTATSLLVNNAGAVFVPQLSTATGGSNQTTCINSSTGELIRETTTVCAVSSGRFKSDINRLTVSGMDVISALRPVSYSYLKDVSYDFNNVQYGFIAEEVAAVDPHLAEYGTDGLPRTLDDRGILSVIVQAIQEVIAKITGLESRLDDQQRQIDALKAELHDTKN